MTQTPPPVEVHALFFRPEHDQDFILSSLNLTARSAWIAQEGFNKKVETRITTVSIPRDIWEQIEEALNAQVREDEEKVKK